MVSSRDQLCRTSKPLPSGVLDALPCRIALLDARGVVIHTNRAWQTSAEGADPFVFGVAPGTDYLAVCETAAPQAGVSISATIDRIKAALSGNFAGTVVEYEIRTAKRLVTLTAERYEWERQTGVALCHQERGSSSWEPQRIGDAECARTAADPPRGGLLSGSNPRLFAGLVDEYGQLLEAGLKQRIYNVPDEVTAGARRMARRFCAALAGPRDVVEVHTAAVERGGEGGSAELQRARLDESRMVLVEVLGYLVSSYRSRADGPCFQCQSEEQPER